MKEKSRIVSNASRAWVAADSLWPPFANQAIIEGEGSIDRAELEKAVAIASEANPGSRLVLKGILGASTWKDTGQPPVVREANGSGWTGLGPEGAGFLQKRLPAGSGPCSEVVLIHGSPLRIALRSHHGIMDGRGTLTWAEDIFRVLRGEEPLGADYLSIEEDLLNVTSTKTARSLPKKYLPPSGPPAHGLRGITWRRRLIKGPVNMLVPRIMLSLARQAWSHGDGNVRIGIPVDLRPRRDNFRSTSNLSNAIFIDISPGYSIEEVSEIIQKKLDLREDGVLTWEDRIVRHVPMRIIEQALLREARKGLSMGHFRTSAIVSNLGRIDLDLFACDTFKPDNLFMIPPASEILPAFIAVTGLKDTINICLGCPAALADNSRIEMLLDRIAEEISQ